jgi:hypothetical protein
MIRLGLRLTVNGGREAVIRLAVITLAVAFGVGMLLITLAGINAVHAQNARYAWLVGTSSGSHSPALSVTATPADPLWWLLSGDQFHGQVIGRVDVAATGPHSPVPPGIAQLPGPGQFYASPALTKLLQSTPAAELGARYPGVQIGTIGASALPTPNALIIVVGHAPAQLSQVPNADEITRISTTTPSSCAGTCYAIGIDANGIDLVLSVVAAAVLFPVLIFIGTATRLSAAPGTALRRHAPGRRHTSSGLDHRRGRIDRCRRRRCGPGVRPVPPAANAARGSAVHRRALLPL